MGATAINDAITCIHAIANPGAGGNRRRYRHARLRRSITELWAGVSDPQTLDRRLLIKIASAVAVFFFILTLAATRPIEDMDAYIEHLTSFVYSRRVMCRLPRKLNATKRLGLAEGEEYRRLQAVQQVLDEANRLPLLVGRPEVIEQKIKQLGLRLQPGKNCEIVHMESSPRYNEYCALFHQRSQREGISVQ